MWHNVQDIPIHTQWKVIENLEGVEGHCIERDRLKLFSIADYKVWMGDERSRLLPQTHPCINSFYAEQKSRKLPLHDRGTIATLSTVFKIKAYS